MISRAIRIYDTNANKMIYPKDGTNNGVFIGMDGYPIQFDGKQFFKLEGCIPMYATGLKASGGVPIWEGDICECDVPVDVGGFTSLVKDTGIMLWNERLGKWYLKLQQNSMQYEGDFSVTNAEVVGNIYEHKHLIKNHENK